MKIGPHTRLPQVQKNEAFQRGNVPRIMHNRPFSLGDPRKRFAGDTASCFKMALPWAVLSIAESLQV